ncbi:hypothetical protein FDK21_15610 [Cohaesibacter sp. CAU 1516]|uniref:efflux RND transporter periplasmic adaptor subunit n=1 Tax=Cohaesibacter sp. CAU 1516 TaxID=2576038 RepID=UPI0010FF1648|nr:hypothetical protein [Cohaesibacter sp. CAU 1516]TLP44223.1 hypothetical protein FDK21_15610 [Cohaesibacter sp. CAU 1516]
MSILKKLLIVPPVALAIGLFVLSGQSAKSPQVATQGKEKPTPVKVIGAKPMTVVPSVSAYGKVQPDRKWDAVAQVAGPVIWTADSLRDGLLIAKGASLLKIDEREYELALAQIEAQIEALNTKTDTIAASLKIEQRALALLEDDLGRKKSLLSRGSTSQAGVDAAERALLTQDAKVQTLKSTLKLNEAEGKVLQQQREISLLNLKRTELKAPFDVRLSSVDISVGQYVNKGQKLFSGDGIAVAEIVAQLPIGALRPLIGKAGEVGAPLNALSSQQGADANRHKAMKAKVVLHTPRSDIIWEARVDRVTAAMDPKTRTRGIVLTVQDPYGQASPGQKPPLVTDTAVEVILQGMPRKNMFALPASAIRKGKVMVVDAEKRLRFKPVKVAYIQGDIAVLMSGLEPKEKVIVSDMPAPVDGMLVGPKPDKKLLERVMAEASGKAPSKGAK